eukprot:65895-Prymnesium_polylepis.1
MHELGRDECRLAHARHHLLLWAAGVEPLQRLCGGGGAALASRCRLGGLALARRAVEDGDRDHV